MDSSDNNPNNHFSWAEFERLEELCEQVSGSEDGFADSATPEGAVSDSEVSHLAVPDATYRQVISLNEALMERAEFLYRKEQELNQRQQELELLKKNLDANLFHQSKDAVEARLDRLINPKAAESKQNINNESSPSDSDSVQTETPGSEFPSEDQEEVQIDFQPLDEMSVETTPTNSSGKKTPDQTAAFHKEAGEPLLQMNRLQQSAATLREKSEVISAVFIELDQMVRELGRQQELLEKLSTTQKSDNSTKEFQLVSDKLKRRFQRLSKQIKVQQHTV